MLPLSIRSIVRVAVLALGIATAFLLAVAAKSHGDPRSTPAWRTPRVWTPPMPRAGFASGMLVGVDPETGRLGMPTEEQRAKLATLAAARATRTSARPAPVLHPDGSLSLDTREWMRDYSVVRTGPGGKLTFRCLDTRDAALRAMHEPVSSPVTEER